jgi:uncharacterized protein
MPKFPIFRKSKQEEEKPAVTSQGPEQPVPLPKETSREVTTPPQEEPKHDTIIEPIGKKQEPTIDQNKTYLKAMPLREINDLKTIKDEVKSGNIIILRVTPLASKSIEEVKEAVNELFEFTESIGGDIARLGEERVVICPESIKIWREKTQVSKESVPTAV